MRLCAAGLLYSFPSKYYLLYCSLPQRSRSENVSERPDRCGTQFVAPQSPCHIAATMSRNGPSWKPYDGLCAGSSWWREDRGVGGWRRPGTTPEAARGDHVPTRAYACYQRVTISGGREWGHDTDGSVLAGFAKIFWSRSVCRHRVEAHVRSTDAPLSILAGTVCELCWCCHDGRQSVGELMQDGYRLRYLPNMKKVFHWTVRTFVGL